MKEKTNVMRVFDAQKIDYKFHTYPSDKAISGVEVANYLDMDCAKVFKTLVTVGKSNKNYVFIIPVAEELDLKKAATSVDEKSVDMLKSRDLLSTTGYIHGGCSPVGMKKTFPTVIHESAQSCQTIVFSAGKIGFQVETSLLELGKVVKFKLSNIIV